MSRETPLLPSGYPLVVWDQIAHCLYLQFPSAPHPQPKKEPILQADQTLPPPTGPLSCVQWPLLSAGCAPPT